MAPGARRKVYRYEEGPAAGARFEGTLERLLKVTKDDLGKREAAYQKATRARPRRGPRPDR